MKATFKQICNALALDPDMQDQDTTEAVVKCFLRAKTVKLQITTADFDWYISVMENFIADCGDEVLFEITKPRLKKFLNQAPGGEEEQLLAMVQNSPTLHDTLYALLNTSTYKDRFDYDLGFGIEEAASEDLATAAAWFLPINKIINVIYNEVKEILDVKEKKARVR